VKAGEVNVIRCMGCGRLGVALNDIRLTRHKCAGQWHVEVRERVDGDVLARALREDGLAAPAKGPRVHWAGGARTASTTWLAGWPCCCSGKAAYRIQATGRQTRDPGKVTCVRCMSIADFWDEPDGETGAGS
jgi:hypothetical protein